MPLIYKWNNRSFNSVVVSNEDLHTQGCRIHHRVETNSPRYKFFVKKSKADLENIAYISASCAFPTGQSRGEATLVSDRADNFTSTKSVQ